MANREQTHFVSCVSLSQTLSTFSPQLTIYLFPCSNTLVPVTYKAFSPLYCLAFLTLIMFDFKINNLLVCLIDIE